MVALGMAITGQQVAAAAGLADDRSAAEAAAVLSPALDVVAEVSTADTSAITTGIRSRMIRDFGGGPEASGRLDFLGGLVLNGPSGFGAWSGLLLDGDQMLAVNDTGAWLSARLVTSAGRPLALEGARLFPRRDVNGRIIAAKGAGDAEALTRVEGGVLVAVEGSAQILRYPATGITIDPAAAPVRVDVDHQLRQVARRNGFEALATLADGTVLAITEGNAKTGPTIPAFRLGGKPFSIARNGDWSITGADTLPGGDVVIVERHYGGGFDVGMRVRRLGVWDLASGKGPIDGPVLLEAGFASQIDNMEGVAATFEDGRIVLTFVSDDNHAMLQRTLLLRFAIRDRLPRRRPDRAQTALWPDAGRIPGPALSASR